MKRLTILAYMASLALLAAACSGGSAKTTPTASATVPAAPPTATITPPPTPTPRPPGSPPPYVGEPRRVLIPRGGAVNAGSGVLFLDPATGGGELWQLPDSGYPSRVSPAGRFIAWMDVTAPRGNTQVAYILDTSTGMSRKSTFAGQSLLLQRFSPDGTHFVGNAGRTIVAAESASGKVLEVHTLTSTEPKDPYVYAEWSPDGTDFAAGASGGESTWLVNDGAARLIPASMRGMEWSHDGRRIAISSLTDTRIVTLNGAPDLTLPAGSSNPRWSFDDRYISVNGQDLNAGSDMRIFDSRSAVEVLRILGTQTCFGDYWVPGQLAVKGQFEPRTQVAVPPGVVAPMERYDTGWNYSDGRTLQFGQDGSALVKDGQTLAEVQGGGSVPYVSDQFDIFRSDGRATLYVGVGGKGLCGEGSSPPFEVLKPPFAD
ncbi:MAG: WD40 repeat domain-containing protein [Anaerolineaceae bacterium]